MILKKIVFNGLLVGMSFAGYGMQSDEDIFKQAVRKIRSDSVILTEEFSADALSLQYGDMQQLSSEHTPLVTALLQKSCNNTHIIALLDAGEDVNAKSERGHDVLYPLEAALESRKRYKDCIYDVRVKELIKRGARVDLMSENYKAYLSVSIPHDMELAALFGDLDRIGQFYNLALEGEEYFKNPDVLSRALRYAALQGNITIVNYFLEKNISFDDSLIRDCGTACRKNTANPGVGDIYKILAFHAFKQRCMTAIQEFDARGFSKIMQSYNGSVYFGLLKDTLLSFALSCQNTCALSVLLQIGADPYSLQYPYAIIELFMHHIMNISIPHQKTYIFDLVDLLNNGLIPFAPYHQNVITLFPDTENCLFKPRFNSPLVTQEIERAAFQAAYRTLVVAQAPALVTNIVKREPKEQASSVAPKKVKTRAKKTSSKKSSEQPLGITHEKPQMTQSSGKRQSFDKP